MSFFKLLILFTLTLPAFTFGAGFAKESLFLSKSPVIEGEAVYIHAVVSNDTNAEFKGEVIFEDGEKNIGTVGVSIAPGGAEAVSLSWKPAAGTHSVVAELTAPDKTVVEKLSATFSIQEKPKTEAAKTVADTGVVQSSDNVKEAIAGISPGLAEAAEPVFTTIDSLRQKGASALDKGIAWAKSDESSVGSGGIGGTVLGVVKTALTFLMEMLKFILNNAGIFYPALAILFLYVLWRTFKRFRRPSTA